MTGLSWPELGSGLAGLIDGQPITQHVYPSSPGTTYSLPLSAENTCFWGQTTWNALGDSELSNCLVAGMDPDLLTTLDGNYSAFDSATLLRPHLWLYDSLVSSLPWTTDAAPRAIDEPYWHGASQGRPLSPGTVRGMSGYSAGIHGGGFSAIRSVIEDVQDCVNYTNGHASSFWEILGSRIWRAYFENGFPGSPEYPDGDGHTHSDLFQYARGKNGLAQFSLFGGRRNNTAYLLTKPNGYREGDDAYGAAVFVKQEVAPDAYGRIANQVWNRNLFRGCGHGFHVVYKASNANLHADFEITNNQFSSVYPADVIVDGLPARIVTSNQLTGMPVSGNVIEGTATAVPITTDGNGEA
jgi:hypothetical protein